MLCILHIESVACLNPGPPAAGALLRWNRYATIAIYECPLGYIFNEGGRTRTLACSNGQWPDLLPVCQGTYDLHTAGYLKTIYNYIAHVR